MCKQGTLTELAIRAALVFSQSWRQIEIIISNGGTRLIHGKPAPNHAHFQQQIWDVFNAQTRLFINIGQQLIQNYLFAGWYMALLSLPRYRFQFIEGNSVRIDAIRLPPRLQMDAWSRVVLVRGSNRNYFTDIRVGDVVRSGTFSSFSRNFQTALNFANPRRDQENPEPILIMIEESIPHGNLPLPAYARRMEELSLFPNQREYLIDPFTSFQVVSIETNHALARRGPDGRVFPVTVILLRFIRHSQKSSTFIFSLTMGVNLVNVL